jgi:membrane-bound serine protease (ClpP class)
VVRRLVGIVILVLITAAALVPLAAAQQVAGGPVLLAEVDGVINPLTARYLERVLLRAAERRASLVVLRLDTPGGLETSMREMTQALLDAPVPVAVYVAPGGARATSAGLFITIAGHVAAMAPATHIGAAHPVALGVEIDAVMSEKMLSDAAALVRSIAAARGRNAVWPEQAVRENLSLTAPEALAEGVIDLVAEDLNDLLRQIDGRSVTVLRERVVVRTAGVPVERLPMTWMEQVVHVITNPDIAYLLLSLGTLLLLAELADPALSLAGLGAVICFVIAFVALGSLPINWAGLGLLALGLILFAVALFTDTEAIVTFVGLVPFVLGSLLLFSPFTPTPPSAPALRVSPWLIGIIALIIVGFSLGVLRAILKAAQRPPQSGAERLIGLRGVALSDLALSGQVRVDLEFWSAVAVDGPISAGQEIVVVGFAGVHLRVKVADTDGKGGS